MNHRKPVENLHDMVLEQGQRLMGLDVGSKTIGVALSDLGRTIATPNVTIRRRKFKADAALLRGLIEEHEVGGLVIGLPLNMDGSEGPRCQATRQFAANLLEKRDLPIAFQDERLSTAAVERMLVTEMDLTRKRRAELIDKLAAAYILQTFLERLGRH
jgi:putative Holliday junction resolvase